MCVWLWSKGIHLVKGNVEALLHEAKSSKTYKQDHSKAEGSYCFLQKVLR